MRRLRLAIGALAIALFARAPAAQAWNNTGHEIIACIAWQNLTPAARESISALLRAHPDFTEYLAHSNSPDAPVSDQRIFELAATWPDWVRTPGRPQYRHNHPEWHYVDFPYVAAGLPAEPEPKSDWKPGDTPTNALQAHQKVLADLKDKSLSDADRAIALCWVEHLDGDIHLPVHAASFFSPQFPNGDKGANSIRITFHDPAIGADRQSALHALWDEMLGTDQGEPVIRAQAVRLMREHPAGEMKDAIAQMDFSAWAKESFTLAQEHVYLNGTLHGADADAVAKNKSLPVPMLPPGYMAQAMSVADLRAALAGYRLAAELEAALTR